MTDFRSPMRSPSDLKDALPIDRKAHISARPWWEDYLLGKISKWKAEMIDRILDSSDDAPKLFGRLVAELNVAPKLARKWIRAALYERGRPEKAKG